MSKKFKVLAIMGKSASGKSHLEKIITSKYKDMNRIISTTTRPKRDYEVDGVDYNFITTDEFAEKIMDGDMIEAVDFNDWFYGTDVSALKEGVINVGVYTPSGAIILAEDPRVDLRLIYVTTDDKTRLLRSLLRETNPDCKEIVRRFMSDEKDFNVLSEAMGDLMELNVPIVSIFNDDGVDLNYVIKDAKLEGYILGNAY